MTGQLYREGVTARQEQYDAEASAAWDRNPKTAMVKYGLPCWCGHYGGCEVCA